MYSVTIESATTTTTAAVAAAAATETTAAPASVAILAPVARVASATATAAALIPIPPTAIAPPAGLLLNSINIIRPECFAVFLKLVRSAPALATAVFGLARDVVEERRSGVVERFLSRVAQ